MGGGASKARAEKAVNAVTVAAQLAAHEEPVAEAEVEAPSSSDDMATIAAEPISGDMGNIAVDLASAVAAPSVAPAPDALLPPEGEQAARAHAVSFSAPEEQSEQEEQPRSRRLTTPGRRSRVPSRPQTADVELDSPPLRTPPAAESVERQRAVLGRPPSRDGPLPA